MRTSMLAGTTVLAAVTWTVALIIDGGPWTGPSSMLIGVGMLTTATVSTVAVIVSGSRWSHRMALGSIGLTLVVAAYREIDPAWWAGLVASALAAAALVSPTLTKSIRKLPAATGPSPRAIAPPIVLLFSPAVLGFVANDAEPWAVISVGISALFFAFAYSRVIPGGLLGIRVVWPLGAVLLSPFLGWFAGSASVALGIAVAVLAWHPAVKASFHPPIESGTTFPIPPELAPSEILDAAGIDDQGRPI